MNDALQPLLDLLGGKAGLLTTIITWFSALKVLEAFIGGWIARKCADKLNEIAASASTDDDGYLRDLFSQPAYKFGAFVALLIGIRLPSLADLERAIKLQKEAAIDAGAHLPAARGGASVPASRSANSILPLPLLISAFAISAFCFSGCGTLDRSGVYAGDQVLYQSELAITTSYDLIHTFVAWEKDNRVALAQWPEIREAANTMRAGAKQWFQTAHALRDVYVAHPTGPNRDNLLAAVSILRTALTEASGYMARAAQPPN